MLRRPVFRPQYLARAVRNEGVFLVSEWHQTVLQGSLYEAIAPLLDGRAVEDVCAALQGVASPAQVFYTLNQLERRGYLTDAENVPPGLSAGESALWSTLGVEPRAASDALAGTLVEVAAVGGLDAAPLAAMLQSLGIRTTAPGAGSGGGEVRLGVVVTDHYLRDALHAYNQESLALGRPWMLVKPVGLRVWVGPVFRPGATGCWTCLAERVRANFPILGYLDGLHALNGSTRADRCGTPATESVAWGLAAHAAADWLTRGEASGLEGCLRTFDLSTWKAETHSLVRQPTCPDCGEGLTDPASTRPEPREVRLSSRKKVYTEDGGHRASTPAETLERFGHHVSPISGVVPMIERASPADNRGVMHVYLSGHNAARGPRSRAGLRRDLRSSSCGKGTCEDQARASALCEGIERYSAIFRGDEPRMTARMTELGEDALHPNACMLISERQYRERDGWNQQTTAYHYVPARFDAEQPCEWTPVWSLTRERAVYLPSAFCYFDYPEPGGDRRCVSCSNGNAAGNTVEEAILQGYFELVERDGVALWWYNRLRKPGVDLDSFDEPYLGRLAEFLESRHRNVWALDLTSDLGVPVFVAASRRTDGGAEQIMFGFGAHNDPKVALLRAMTEMNQMLVCLLDAPPEGPADDRLTDPETLHWLRTATLETHPYLAPSPGPARKLGDYPRAGSDDLKDDVEECRRRVERLGMEMLVLDQTRPEIGMPVVKVIVPGLRHFWARFAPGRLYDVPVRLGWLDRPTDEDRLNPTPMFL